MDRRRRSGRRPQARDVLVADPAPRSVGCNQACPKAWGSLAEPDKHRSGTVSSGTWRSYGNDPLPSARKPRTSRYPSPGWFLRIVCDRCGKERTIAETHMPQGDVLIRDVLEHMRHDGCGGRVAKAELLTGIDGSSRPVRRIVLTNDATPACMLREVIEDRPQRPEDQQVLRIAECLDGGVQSAGASGQTHQHAVARMVSMGSIAGPADIGVALGPDRSRICVIGPHDLAAVLAVSNRQRAAA